MEVFNLIRISSKIAAITTRSRVALNSGELDVGDTLFEAYLVRLALKDACIRANCEQAQEALFLAKRSVENFSVSIKFSSDNSSSAVIEKLTHLEVAYNLVCTAIEATDKHETENRKVVRRT